MPRKLAVLGSTGSIGTQTLDIVRRFPDRLKVVGLSGHSRVDLLRDQAEEFRPATVAVTGPGGRLDVDGVDVTYGEQSVVSIVTRDDIDLVVVGTAGSGGLAATLAALRAGKLVALANKETLVMAGVIIREELRAGRGALVPIDSEHSAIWQCLQGEPRSAVERLTLTASGGALRTLSAGQLQAVTPAQALQHPTWRMGRKITVDSANLMNKGLEVIEAQWLFDLPLDSVEVVLHPQSIVHSLITFADSSTKAQLGLPDMRLPILYALSHPERWPVDFPRLELAATGTLSFAPIDLDRYPALRLALEAGHKGGTYPCVLSAADECAVEAFLTGQLDFTGIPELVGAVLDRHTPCWSPKIEDILESDRWARETARSLLARM